MRFVTLLAALLTAAPLGSAQDGERKEYPFAVGESFRYSAKLGFLRLGTGVIEVAGLDTVRGHESFVFRFALEGGNSLYRLNSVLESRTTVEDFISLEFHQNNDENGRVYTRHFEIFPDSGFYRLNRDSITHPTSERPLDDAAFLYFMRSFPLQVGRSYELNHYFKKEKNPLQLEVEKRERVELPDGSSVECLVIHPVLGDRGIFARRQDARVWLTDDERRIPVQIRTRYPFGTVILRIENMRLAGTTPIP